MVFKQKRFHFMQFTYMKNRIFSKLYCGFLWGVNYKVRGPSTEPLHCFWIPLSIPHFAQFRTFIEGERWPRFHSSSETSWEARNSSIDGNQPYSRRSTRMSPVRPVITSTPSATSASRWRWAPSVPGPREEIVPAEPITRCHGIGGFTFGGRNFNAVIYFRLWRANLWMTILTLSYMTWMVGHPS